MMFEQQHHETSGPHVLSFDVEEHFQVSAFWSHARREQWDRLESRVEQNTLRLMELLAYFETKATFFVLGWVAERYPGLVKALAKQGHEIASHGYGHQLVTNQTASEFRDDVRRSKRILEDLTGSRVLGYRAPSFSITARTLWALPILAEEEYLYDSSIFPVRHDCYGMPSADPWCHVQKTEAGTLWEVPPSTLKVGPLRIPVAGGGYFRLYPYRLLRRFLRSVASQGHPLIMYLHPWELDPEQPRMDGSTLSRFRHYLNLHKTEARLRQLLADFRFTTIRNAVKEVKDAYDTYYESIGNVRGHVVTSGYNFRTDSDRSVAPEPSARASVLHPEPPVSSGGTSVENFLVRPTHRRSHRAL